MVQEQIEKVKSEYTDKYVSVVGDRPEHRRFAGLVGQVRTVNMSGRALVEWLGFHDNIGWYDIDLDYLKVVDKPAEPEPAAKPATKPSGKKPSGGLSPLEQLRQQGSSKPAKPKPQAGLSPLEILRQQAAAKQAPSAETSDSTDEPAAEPDKPSTSDILAKLRQQGGKS